MRHREVIMMILVVGTLIYIPIGILLLFFILVTDSKDKELPKVEDIPLSIFQERQQETVATTKPITIEDKQAYLLSPKWNNKRKLRLALDGYTCQGCGIDGVPLEVHHIHYNTLFNESVSSDIISVCRKCHQDVHTRLGYSYHGTYPIKIRRP